MKKQFTMEDVPVLYEDKHIIVVVKPQNMPSQEDKSGDTDLFNLLKEYIRQKYDKQGNVFLGLVHRLDRTTGGLMVFAKNSKCAARLSEAIKNGEVDKRYLAVLVGKPREKSATLVNYLKKNSLTNTVSQRRRRRAPSARSFRTSCSIRWTTSFLLSKSNWRRGAAIRFAFSFLAGGFPFSETRDTEATPS